MLALLGVLSTSALVSCPSAYSTGLGHDEKLATYCVLGLLNWVCAGHRPVF